MAEYIEREAFMEKFSARSPLLMQIRAYIAAEPAADVEPVKHGRWNSNDLNGYKWAFVCSECGWVDGYPFNDRHNYCPNCGAKMKE